MFSDYELIKVLAVGSYAVVYQVRHKQSQKNFALKVIEKEPMAVRLLLPQLQREIQILQDLSHCPHIVELLEATETDSHAFLRFELCQASLEDVCAAKKGGMTEEEAFHWLRQACLGVKEMHENGVVHRDLKPSNFLVDFDGNLSICDFGFACANRDGLTGMTGTPCYGPPETRQEGSKHTYKTDIYNLGASLQHFLLGRVPQGPSDMPKCSASATRILQDMMNVDPKKRPNIYDLLDRQELAGEVFFSQWLRQWLETLPVQVPLTSPLDFLACRPERKYSVEVEEA